SAAAAGKRTKCAGLSRLALAGRKGFDLWLGTDHHGHLSLGLLHLAPFAACKADRAQDQRLDHAQASHVCVGYFRDSASSLVDSRGPAARWFHRPHFALSWIAFKSGMAHSYARAGSARLESCDARFPARPWQNSEPDQHSHAIRAAGHDPARLVLDLLLGHQKSFPVPPCGIRISSYVYSLRYPLLSAVFLCGSALT